MQFFLYRFLIKNQGHHIKILVICKLFVIIFSFVNNLEIVYLVNLLPWWEGRQCGPRLWLLIEFAVR